MPKELVVIAGPNRSGKTTLYNQRKDEFPEILLSVNEMVKDQNFSTINDERTMYLSAVNHASFVAQSLVEHGSSFCMETVMSSRHKLDLFKEAHRAGYNLKLLYVGTASPQVNLDRVEEGPYGVAWLDVINRYENSLKILQESWELFSEIEVYDGTADLLLCAKKDRGKTYLLNKEIRPEWVTDMLRGVAISDMEKSETESFMQTRVASSSLF